MKSSAQSRRPAAGPTPKTPWSSVDQDPAALAVQEFPVTLVVQLGNALRRLVTTRYAEDFGLSEAEWRMFTLIANFTPIGMAELVTLSASDKALVSRSVKALKDKALIRVKPDPGGNLKKLVCEITAAGLRLHKKAFPVAQKRQAEILAPLTRAERDCLYVCLLKLNAHCEQLGLSKQA